MQKNNLGLEVLSCEEISSFLSLTNKLSGFPNSVRLFNELHCLSLNILWNKGKKTRLLSRRAEYIDFNSDSNFGIELTYQWSLFGDYLDLAFNHSLKYGSLSLARKRGYNVLKKDFSNSFGFFDIFAPSPYFLGISTPHFTRTIVYS